MAGYAAMSKQLEVRFSVQGAIREDRQTKSFVSYCPVLDLYSAGKTRPDAKRALTAAVETYVRVCYERGILGRILKEKGFTAAAAAPPVGLQAKAPIQFIEVAEYASEYDDMFDVEVPLHLVAAAATQPEKVGCLQ